MIVVAIVGILATLSIYGVRKYVANAKSTEARNSLGQIGKDAATAFEKETMAGAIVGLGKTAASVRTLCGSATQTVPASATSIQGTKYQSNQAPAKDWSFDAGGNKGFSCLKFSMSAPQYYMYNYVSDGNPNATPPVMGTQFVGTANGDLNGDGRLSTFTMVGAVATGNLYLAPSIAESSPEE
jgi:type IV pilus assembly protein PilA